MHISTSAMIYLSAAVILCGPSLAAASPPRATLEAQAQFERSSSVGFELGEALAVDGDTLAVQAPNSSLAGPGWGEVQIWSRAGAGGWTLRQTLTYLDIDPQGPATNVSGLRMGQSLALDGDRLAVGIPTAKSLAGEVALFSRRDGGSWGFDALIVPSDAASGDRFGTSLDLQGTTLVARTPHDDEQVIRNTGSVYVFELQGGSWSQTQRLSLSPSTQDSRFGSVLALDGDDLVIGLRPPGNESRDAHAYRRGAGGQWTWSARLSGPGDGTVSRFGRRLALSQGTAVVSSRGRVHVFRRNAMDWTRTQSIASPNNGGSTVAEFGETIAIDGDAMAVASSGTIEIYGRQGTTFSWSETVMASDGVVQPGSSEQAPPALALEGERLYAGNPYDAPGGVAEAGRVYLFEKQGTWTMASSLEPAPLVDDLGLGQALAIDGDRAIVSTQKVPTRVFVTERQPDGEWGELTELVPAALGEGSSLGASIAIDGGLAVLGAPGANAAVVFERDASDGQWREGETLEVASLQEGDAFGCAVYVHENMAAVGACGEESVYIFDRDAQGQWQMNQKIVDGNGFARFGAAIAGDGHSLMIGAAPEEGSPAVGSVVWYKRQPNLGDWEALQLLTTPDNPRKARFGAAIAIEGDVAVIGAPNYGDDLNGQAYIYALNDRWELVKTVEACDVDEQPRPVPDRVGIAVDIEGDHIVIGAHHRGVVGGREVAGSGNEVILVERDEAGVWQDTTRIAGPSEVMSFGRSLALSRGTLLVGAPRAGARAGDLFGYELPYEAPIMEPEEDMGIAAPGDMGPGLDPDDRPDTGSPAPSPDMGFAPDPSPVRDMEDTGSPAPALGPSTEGEGGDGCASAGRGTQPAGALWWTLALMACAALRGREMS